ncbi:MAG: protein kinase [Planctomycetota bacterium]
MSSAEIKHDFLDPPDPENGAADHLGTIAHYRVIRELGKGGMGYVFLAEDVRLKREVALKVMNQKIAATPGSRKRFISEARAMAAVHHDNVATIFEVGEYKGTPFMAMELLEGSTLESLAETENRPGYVDVIRYARDMARGLAAAHAQGIVHRDIKPANIWLDSKTDRIKILDFGLALAATPVDQLSGRGSVVGTPGYLSPEQARSEPLDDRSDLYSTGVVLYELACGRLPLKTKSVAEQLIAILAHDPPALRKHNADIPKPLADLIHRLMAKEPRDRVQSAAKLEEVLDKVEVECESKSEVAQAINQLQAGLDKVVQKKEPVEAAPVATPAPAPNPFDALPSSIPAAPLANDPLGPVQTPASGTFGAATRKKAPPKKESSPMAMWIAIGVIAVGVLVVLPIAVFWGTSNSLDRQQQVDQANMDDTIARVKERANQPKQEPANPSIGGNSNTSSVSAVSLLNDPPAMQRPSIKAKQLNAPGARWIIGAKQANGSFEDTRPDVNAARVPGWTVRRSGPDAGWRIASSPITDLGVVAAFAGEKSEIQVIGDPIKYRANAGDVFRLGAHIGGEQKGMTDYRVILGFKADDGSMTRYQLAKVAEGAMWGVAKNARRLRFEYTATADDAGKHPFLEFTLSNKNRGRKGRTYLDRAVLTVVSANQASVSVAKPPADSVAARPNAQPKSSPTASSMNVAAPNANARSSSNNQSRSSANNRLGNGAANKPESASSTALREARLSTSDQLGADTSVKRGSGRETLGEQLRMAVQSRNGKQIQHAYLRFNLDSLRKQEAQGQRPNTGFGGNRNAKKVNVKSATLELTLAGSKRPSDARLTVYGLGDERSDIWPENRLVWNNSLSAAGLNTLPLLAEVTVGEGDPAEPLVVSVSSPQLAAFIANIEHSTFTLVVAGENGNEPIYFAAKEDSRRQAPAIRLSVPE